MSADIVNVPMSGSNTPATEAEPGLLAALHRAIAAAPSPPIEIEVGIALSIALGRTRPTVACGGCAVPLEFEGIPARTNAGLHDPFRLIFTPPEPPARN